jgi:alpha-mannosidase
MNTRLRLITCLCIVAWAFVFSYDLSTDKVQYIVTDAHLDTQWMWTIEQTINEFLPNTFNGNFALINDHPGYVFNFEGAYRYMLIKKHYPGAFQKIKELVASGNWAVAGGMVDACDVNIPSPESLIRQILYGNGFFLEEFGKTSADIFLPDCFGFGYALPTVAAHCGMLGFSSMKLVWSDRDIPFTIGRWEGADGSSLVAVLKTQPYNDNRWEIRTDDINDLGNRTGAYANYRYFGIGDAGGANDPGQVASLMDRIRQNDNTDLKVVCASSDQFFRDLKQEHIDRMQVHKGELLMCTHGTGCYSVHAELKYRNRMNELRAYEAECAASAARWLDNTYSYPAENLKKAWIRFLCHQFHDDLTGTSIPEAYVFSRRDYDSSLAEFRSIRDEALDIVSRHLDTRTEQGIPVVVFNPLSIERSDIAEAVVRFASQAPQNIRVFDPAGQEVASQGVKNENGTWTVLFAAAVPSLGFTVFDIRPSDTPFAAPGNLLSISENILENPRYKVSIDNDGNISQIYDKQLNRDILWEPAKLELFNDYPDQYPAWEIKWGDLQSPRSYFRDNVQKEIVEQGPVRVTLKVSRMQDGSQFVQHIHLGINDRIDIENLLDWQADATLLKASFSLKAADLKATYDLGIGTIERPNSTESLYEVPAQQWADITDRSGQFGTAILNNCKYGWDKPADNRLRLTLIHCPRNDWGYHSDDKGRHEFTYSIYSHKNEWRAGGVVWEAARLNNPLIAFQAEGHEGPRGKKFSFITPGSERIAVMAAKKAERGSELIVRVRETDGLPLTAARLTFPALATAVKEANGFEDNAVQSTVRSEGQDIVFDIKGYQPKTFAVTLGEQASTAAQVPTPSKHRARSTSLHVKVPSYRSITAVIPLELDETVERVFLFDGAGRIVARAVTGNNTHDSNTLAMRGRNGRKPFSSVVTCILRVKTNKGDQAVPVVLIPQN